MKPIVTIIVEDGMVSEVYCNIADIEIEVIDFDVQDEDAERDVHERYNGIIDNSILVW